MTSFNVRSIAIIGAGPAGLASAKYLIQQRAFQRVVIFEQQAEVGGVWNYSKQPSRTTRVPQTNPLNPPDPPVEACGGDGSAPIFPTPMYHDLNTNIPHTLMNFSDLAFPKGSIIFPPREAVQSYLIAYARSVRDLIRFCTQVIDVRLRQSGTRDLWEIQYQDTKTGSSGSEAFDAVVVANGHYALPYVPGIKGISDFHERYPDIISHSKTYRDPGPYRGKRTIVVGNAASGLDIARQINAVCQQPLLISAQTPTPPAQLEHTGGKEAPEIEEFLPIEPPSVRLKDGRITEVDKVLFCTGYLFSFPFIKNDMLEPPIVQTGRRVQGLYRHLFHIQHPTIVFPGLLIKAVPFPICEGQAAVFSRVWSNCLPLPPMSEMAEWEKTELLEKGEAMHVLPSGGDIDYINGMHDWAMKAAENEGKEPPRWEGELIYQRHTYKDAKLAFEKDGRKAKSLAEIGFVYDPSKPVDAS